MQPHINGRGGELLSFHHCSSQPLRVLPLSLCSFFIIFDHIRGGKKGRAAAPSWGCWQELHCPDRPAQLRVRVPGIFHPVSGFGFLNCFCLALMRRNLLGAFAFLHGWVAVPKLRALHERGLQGHLGSLLSSKELLGTEAGMLLGALKSQRDLLGKKKQNLGSFKPLGGSFLGWCHTKPWWWLQHFRLPIAWTEASAPHL